mmetsp:Transcript_30790/g.79091  ORF Transcript_30790/g.79091 Transcript_30790/m.79091 type:complete len:142 (-) Transcript_30790:1586-2011(-)
MCCSIYSVFASLKWQAKGSHSFQNSVDYRSFNIYMNYSCINQVHSSELSTAIKLIHSQSCSRVAMPAFHGQLGTVHSVDGGVDEFPARHTWSAITGDSAKSRTASRPSRDRSSSSRSPYVMRRSSANCCSESTRVYDTYCV